MAKSSGDYLLEAKNAEKEDPSAYLLATNARILEELNANMVQLTGHLQNLKGLSTLEESIRELKAVIASRFPEL